MDSANTAIALDGEYQEEVLPLLIRRIGMAEFGGDHVRVLDRRLLPHEEKHVICSSVEEVANAIEDMVIQGAFTTAIAAGYGLALALSGRSLSGHQDTAAALGAAAERLSRTRPTGLAVRRVVSTALASAIDAANVSGDVVAAIVSVVDAYSSEIARQALATGRWANSLIPDGAGLLTHCFADRAFLYTLLEARRSGKELHIYCSETRPYLQGARLTAPSILQIGYTPTLVTDGMGGLLMYERRVDMLLTAADRVCMDGTICNKVGTFQFAASAAATGIPYYVLRQSGPDRESLSAADIDVEYRSPKSVVECCGKSTTVDGVEALYPAFDVTPANLVTSIICDRGIYNPTAIATYFDSRGPAALSASDVAK